MRSQGDVVRSIIVNGKMTPLELVELLKGILIAVMCLQVDHKYYIDLIPL